MPVHHRAQLPISRRLLAAGIALGLLAACGKTSPRPTALPAGSRVLALGDSLTAGVGAAEGEDFPSLLADLTGWQVINAGVSGDTSEQALARLAELLAAHQPQLVIIGLGGNDFLRQIEVQRTRQALTAVIEECRSAHAQPLLLAIPRPSLRAAAGLAPADHPLYAELAQQLQVPLVAGAWGAVLGDADLRADAVHANARGYAAFVQALEAALREQGWLA